MTTIANSDRNDLLLRLGVSPTVIAGLSQTGSALIRSRDQGCGSCEVHLLRAISELHRAIDAIDHSDELRDTLLSRWHQLAIEASEFRGLAQNSWKTTGAIEKLLLDAILSVERSVGLMPNGTLKRRRASRKSKRM